MRKQYNDRMAACMVRIECSRTGLRRCSGVSLSCRYSKIECDGKVPRTVLDGSSHARGLA